jgi:cytoskeletal protein CcmA (bactofilin family)
MADNATFPIHGLNAAEQWVCERLQAGEPADLSKFAGDASAPHQISTSFLASILFKEPWTSAIQANSIEISNASINCDAPEWNQPTLTRSLVFHACKFIGPHSICSMMINGQLHFSECEFTDTVHVSDCRVSYTVIFVGCQFAGELQILSNSLSQLELTQCKGKGAVYLENTQASDSILVHECEFEGNLQVDGSEISKLLEVKKCNLGEMNVYGARIGRGAVCTETTIKRRASFSDTWIDGPCVVGRSTLGGGFSIAGGRLAAQLSITGSKLGGLVASRLNAAQITLSECTINGGLTLDHAQIQGPIDVSGGQIAGSINCDEMNVRGTVSIEELKVGQNVSLNRMEAQKSVTFKKVEISGVAELISASIGGTLQFEQCTLTGYSDWTSSSVAGDIIANETKFSGDLVLSRSTSQGSVAFSDCELRAIHCDDARILASFSILKCSASEPLNLNQLNVSMAIGFDESSFVEAQCRYLRCGGAFSVHESKFTRGLDLNSAHVSGHLLIVNSTFGEDCDFAFAQFGGGLSTEDCTFKSIEASAITVDGLAAFRKIREIRNLGLTGAKIGHLQLRESKINGVVDLSSATIRGELHLAKDKEKPGPVWGETARIEMRNLTADSIVAPLEAFCLPSTNRSKRRFVSMDLAGMSYNRFGGLGATNSTTLADSSAKDLMAWLAAGHRPKMFTPDPYRRLAQALFQAGHVEKGKRILHAMRIHERRCERSWLRRLSLHLSGMAIGFGHRNEYAVAWLFLLVGAVATFGLNVEGLRTFDFSTAGVARVLDWVWFSLGNALPLITLDKAHEVFLANQLNVSPDNVPAHISSVFYMEKLFGFALISYLAAGISGLASRGER